MTKFYVDTGEIDLSKLLPLVDNGTTHVTIQTPKGWKCKRKNCTSMFKHTHGIYPSLNAKPRTKSRRLLNTKLDI
jgi:hypothetical protein